jgi:hypothetical protein
MTSLLFECSMQLLACPVADIIYQTGITTAGTADTRLAL